MSSLQKFSQTLEEFNQEVGQLKEVSGAYKKLQTLTETYNEINKQFEQNSSTLEKINELHKAQQEKVEKSLTALENLHKQHKDELSKLVEEKTDQIRKDNKEFYRDLESTIKIKLDENRSEIKQLIESERSHIKQLFEIESAKNTKELSQLITSQGKTVKIFIWVAALLVVLLNTAALFIVLKK